MNDGRRQMALECPRVARTESPHMKASTDAMEAPQTSTLQRYVTAAREALYALNQNVHPSFSSVALFSHESVVVLSIYPQAIYLCPVCRTSKKSEIPYKI